LLVVAVASITGLATFFDWALYREAMRHRAKFGHMHFHQDLLLMAILTSSFAALAVICFVVIALRHRRIS